jgi:signal transduction histidine kinase
MEDVARAGMAVSEAVAVLPQANVQAVLEILALNASNLTAAEFVAAGIGTDPQQPFEHFAFVGLSRELAEQIGGRPRPVGLLGLVQDRAVRARDLRALPEYHGFPASHPVMTSFLGVPIRRKGTAIGSLYLANKRDHAEFTEHDQRMVEMLVERADVAIETAQLFSAEGIKRAWFQAVIDQMPEGIVLMDAEGQMILQNRSMTSLAAAESTERDRFGNPVAVDLRRPSGERVSPDEIPIVKAIVEQATTQGSEFVAQRADGRLVPLLVSAAPIRGDQGELVGATMIFQDVSTLKELEHLREEWASIVAHDLQQPIGAIVLRSDLLLQEGLSPKQRHEVAEVQKAAKRLSRMANDLMDASQLEAKRLQVSLNRIDLSQLLHSVTQRVPGAATRVEIRSPPNRRLFVNGDEHRLEQVVTNLLSNALKYSTPDTVIHIDVGEDQRNAQVQVSVTNRGHGIPEHELPSLFARFVRSRAARTSATTGSGLGLYIAKGLIEAHGGRIWAESIPDENTTFHFTIPINGPPAQTVASLDEVLHPAH